MGRYGELGYSRTLLEVQKLAYFLQGAGEPLRLRYTKQRYGPFAQGLNKALQHLEGHFIVGLGDDAKPGAQIDLLPEAVDEARKVLSAQPEVLERFERVARLIEGFETPYGLELLASVHWLADVEKAVANPAEATSALQTWTHRKAHLFRESHVQKAWERLKQERWISAA